MFWYRELNLASGFTDPRRYPLGICSITKILGWNPDLDCPNCYEAGLQWYQDFTASTTKQSWCLLAPLPLYFFYFACRFFLSCIHSMVERAVASCYCRKSHLSRAYNLYPATGASVSSMETISFSGTWETSVCISCKNSESLKRNWFWQRTKQRQSHLNLLYKFTS